VRVFSVEPRTHARCKDILCPSVPFVEWICSYAWSSSNQSVNTLCNHVYFSKVAFVTEWYHNDYPDEELEPSDLSDEPEDSEEDAFYDGCGDERRIGVG